MKKTLKENRIVCKCRKCNKPYSYNKFKGYAFGDMCRECARKVKNHERAESTG